MNDLSKNDGRDRAELGLFEGIGIELEYMIVDAETLSVRPIADRLLRDADGEIGNEVEHGSIALSNELAAHVIEFKTNGPVASARTPAAAFQEEIRAANAVLARDRSMLLPTAMHPWMQPDRDLVLWPHEDRAIYAAFDRIFACQGHGWSNLQSMHVNLPFRGDEEFARLHAAVRLLLPILPALAASSPIFEDRPSEYLDTRLEFYRSNARRVPSVAGLVIPEPMESRAQYEDELLGRIYADLAPLDPEGLLRHEWVNSRGCIARFDRNALEIRVLDVQECPAADLAIAGATVAVLRWLVEEREASYADQHAFDSAPLAQLLLGTIRDADATPIHDRAYLRALGWTRSEACTAGSLWADLVDRVLRSEPGFDEWREPLEVILTQGCLARRILRRLGGRSDRESFEGVYRELARCLDEGRSFPGDAR